MASHHKKESEGIALLSIYGDEDDEMEEIEAEDGGHKPQDEQEEQQFQQVQVEQREQELSIEENPSTFMIQENTTIISSTIVASGSLGNQDTTTFIQEEWHQSQDLVSNDNSTPGRVGGLGSASGTPRDSLSSPAPVLPLQQQLVLEQRQRKERIAIVDYGHDEVAMSPEPEEGEITVGGNDLAMNEGDFQEKTVQVMTPSDLETPPQLSEPNDQVGTDVINFAINGSESVGAGDAVMVSAEEPKDIDLLNKFLPPPQKTKCSDELQEKIIKFLALRKTTGRSYNAEVRNRKEYRNPDFLRHAVTYQDIDEIGSCFSKDVFDPHGYDQSDFYDEIEADMRREIERKEQERKRSPKIDFYSGGTQPGMVIPSKINLPIPVVPGSGMNTITAAVDTVARDGRQNKKSKSMVIEKIFCLLVGRILCLLLQHMLLFCLLLMLVVDTLLMPLYHFRLIKWLAWNTLLSTVLSAIGLTWRKFGITLSMMSFVLVLTSMDIIALAPGSMMIKPTKTKGGRR